MLRKQLLIKSLLAVCAICVATPAVQAAIVTQPVAPGTPYRLVFVTSVTTDATSSNIDTYNTLASNAAAAIPELAGLKDPWGDDVTWTAIVSTAARDGNPNVDARDNTGTNPNDPNHFDVEIYNLRGLKVAGTNSDLWDGSIQSAINMTEQGNTFIGNVWTGSANNGTEYLNPGSGGAGSFGGQTVFGDSGSSTTGAWVNNGSVAAGNQYRIYAISSVVPEPSTLIMWSVLVGIGLAVLRRKRSA